MGQMNVRIDDQLKDQGDRVFELHGFTPSMVVRKIWQYAAETKEVPEFLYSIVDSDPEERRSRRRTLAESGVGMATRILGMKPLPAESLLSYKELREEAYLERLIDGEH